MAARCCVIHSVLFLCLGLDLFWRRLATHWCTYIFLFLNNFILCPIFDCLFCSTNGQMFRAVPDIHHPTDCCLYADDVGVTPYDWQVPICHSPKMTNSWGRDLVEWNCSQTQTMVHSPTMPMRSRTCRFKTISLDFFGRHRGFRRIPLILHCLQSHDSVKTRNRVLRTTHWRHLWPRSNESKRLHRRCSHCWRKCGWVWSDQINKNSVFVCKKMKNCLLYKWVAHWRIWMTFGEISKSPLVAFLTSSIVTPSAISINLMIFFVFFFVFVSSE